MTVFCTHSCGTELNLLTGKQVDLIPKPALAPKFSMFINAGNILPGPKYHQFLEVLTGLCLYITNAQDRVWKIIGKYLLEINLGGKRFLLLSHHEIFIFPSKMTDSIFISTLNVTSPMILAPFTLPSSSFTPPPLPLRSNIIST